MSKRIAVIYRSKYGSTRQYAQWIAEALGADLFEGKQVLPAKLHSYDVVIYGGGLYAGGIAGVKLVAQNPVKALVVFTVGAANPNETDYGAILGKNFTPEQLNKTRIFHLRGNLDYTRMNLLHRTMMSMMKKHIKKQPETQRSAEDQVFLKTFGHNVQMLDKTTIEPLVAYVRGMV